jgi:hypothetical protein
MFLAIMVLPRPWGGDEHDVAVRGQGVEGERRLDERAVDLIGPVPIEVGHGLVALELGAALAPRPRRAFLERHDVLDGLGEAPALGGDEGHDVQPG